MDVNLSGKVVVVTGAAQGIGRALALGLAAEGARVGVLARDGKRAQAVVDEIEALPGEALALEADAADETAVAAAVDLVDRTWGGLDGLVNNAGRMRTGMPVLDTDVAELGEILRSNLVSAVVCTKRFAPLMIRSGGGRIVYLSSAASLQANAGGSAYAGAKAAINSLAAIVHTELAGHGVRTTALVPGLTVTPGMREVVTDEHLERVASRYPGGRVGQPEDLVGLVTFLCSDVAAHVSGSVLAVRPPVDR
ncbi:SDR family NAD(P)-dependent oxidoreductase [Pseudonocardia endophytica]|uniref:3-oxoacyl-[acyl-carrier protein] reductase n=1 Tax=Pseudonocardia endophytica TaxID=401976 RepID=A0A4R1HMP2_PSEEN|nr:SDR family oxidoreductase [Pseudonocardia endophytica]TCK21600.1 3-oxoacyl-[acyl-carrier protein] reductase [Pseudonocardia endophytica]